MHWRRAERVVWAGSGISLGIALVLLVQNRQDWLVMLFIVISLGISLLFEMARRLVDGTDAERPGGQRTD
jgi:hypothetical protein